jgi:hypothetical protein
MHIVFGYISSWQIPIMLALKFFKLKVYYIHINATTKFKKIEIAEKMRKKDIYPLPIEFNEKISSKGGFGILFHDPNEFSFKKNKEIIPDTSLKKYSSLFSIDKNNTKKLRLLIQDFVYARQLSVSSHLGVWSASYPTTKIVYVSFNFRCFYMSDVDKNIFKIIIPLDFFSYLFRVIQLKKIFLLFNFFKSKINNKPLNVQTFENKESKSIAILTHQGLSYGSGNEILFEKSLYYSDDKNSPLNKYNILHLDYSNFSSPDKKLHWICLQKIKVSTLKVLFKTLIASIKTFYLIRSWSTFLGWLLCIQKYSVYMKYCEAIKQFKKLKIAIIDYDILCPKPLLLALEKNNIKTVATQERFIHTFCNSYANVIIDTYYTTSEFTNNLIKKSKYNDTKNLVAVGLYRSDYLKLYKKNHIPDEISEAKKNGNKVLIILGYQPPDLWFESHKSIYNNWSSQISFLEDVIKLSKILDKTLIVIRYKSLNWIGNNHFKDILKKINDCKNITISNNFKESFYSYKLCANADLVIAKHTSLADECLSNEIPVLFYDYTHNMKKLMSEAFDYSPSRLMCYNFDELLEKSKSLLFNDSSELKNEIAALKNTIYYVKERANIKNKIIGQLESLISSANTI